MGYLHTCAVSGSGLLRCAGDNERGQVGDGTFADRATPLQVLELGAVVDVSGGENHTCAVLANGGVRCWGDNTLGQRGNEQGQPVLVPTDVVGLGSGVMKVVGSSVHSCALMSDATVKCWGVGGEVGDGTSLQRRTPVTVPGLPAKIVGIAASGIHTCALTDGGAVWCWGGNADGQLGDGTTTFRNAPVPVSGLTSDVASIVAGDFHSCAVMKPGTMKCWGRNDGGQLGDGTRTMRLEPVPVTGLTSQVIGADASWGGTCATTTTGAFCWGSNASDSVPDGSSSINQTIPRRVNGLESNIQWVAAGAGFSCAITAVGGVKCWGFNQEAQLGNGSTQTSRTPVAVTGLTSGVTDLAIGYWHSCVLAGGGVTCWGINQGRLGNGVSGTPLTPQAMVGMSTGVASIGAAYFHTCGVTSAGSAWCSGLNYYGALGNGEALYSPYPVPVAEFGTSSGGEATPTPVPSGNATVTPSSSNGSTPSGAPTTPTPTPTAVPETGGCTTDTEQDGATPLDPFETTVVSPDGGSCTIAEGLALGTPALGYRIFGQEIVITAPPASGAQPLTIVFTIDASQIPPGQSAYAIRLTRDGQEVMTCAGHSGQAVPDPCVAQRRRLADGDVEITVLTSHASIWHLNVAALDAYLCYTSGASAGVSPVAPALGHELADAFATKRFDLAKPGKLCLPAARDGVPIGDGATALQTAAVKAGKVCSDTGLACGKKVPCPAPGICAAQAKLAPQKGVVVLNALGAIVVDATKPSGALLPSGTAASHPAGAASSLLDTFECHATKPHKKVCIGDPTRACDADAACGDAGPCFTAFPKGLMVRLEEPVGTSGGKTFLVKKPTALCLPAALDGAARNVPSTSLECYAIAPEKKQPKHVPVVGLAVTSATLGELRRDTKKESELCVPSEMVSH
jgi:alpha-tubulin suppressor-like RCC1 family protein